ncbi:MAG: carboxymuconolactone decarboxylase family protein [Gammaproteobacteria bacterium]
MPRILPVNPDQTDAKTAATLKAARVKLGILPNLFTTLAQAPAALNGYLQLSESLSQGRLSARQREMIAIAVAQENACAYCLSAHAAIGQGVGLSDEDIERARHGGARDPKDDAVTELALRIVQSRADISDSTLTAARQTGLDDGLIIEIIAHVALNVLTNYVNRIAGTDVDFPVVDLSPAA